MSKLGDIFKIGAGVAKPFIPGVGGSILDAVTKSLNDKDDPENREALITLAHRCDELEAAVLVLHERVKKLEKK